MLINYLFYIVFLEIIINVIHYLWKLYLKDIKF